VPDPQIVASDVAVEYGGTPLFEHVSFTVGRGERWGIVGRNGTGKTTLLNLVVGAQEPHRGTLTRGTGLRITVLDQHRIFSGATTVWEAAAGPFDALRELERSLTDQAHALAGDDGSASPEALARYDRDLERFRREGGYEMEARVDAVLHGLGFDPARARTQPVAQLSGGEAGRIGLARQLAAPADVVLLDEPTNHLDLDTTHWLEDYLKALDATVMVVSHDREFLENVTDHTLHVDADTATPYTGAYSVFVEQHAQRALTQERAYQAQQRFVAKEEDYIRRNIAGQLSRQAKGRRKRLARLPRLSLPPSEDGSMSLRLEPKQRGGDQVLVARGLRLSVGDRVLLDGFDGHIRRGEVVGLVGANGTGKSTLLDTVAGVRAPQGGEVRVGASIEVAYYRQDMTQIPMGRSLFDVVYDLRPFWNRGQVQAHLGRFGFPGEAAQRTADTLSGGERARVALAMLMLSRANFLLLDEPTNHLDVESVEALEDAVESFEGTVLLVSHDRALLRSLVTRVWALEGETITDYPGTFTEWQESRAARPKEPPRRIQERGRTRVKGDRGGASEAGARESRRGRPGRPDPERTKLRALRAEVEQSETEIHELEARAAELEGALAEAALYETQDGVRRAMTMKQELADAQERLARAMDRWTRAGETLAEHDEALS
jgi:ATP-binding cassette subfamily F protein 3